MKCLIQLICVFSVLCIVTSRSVPKTSRNGMAYYRAVQPRYIKRAIQPQRVAQPQRVLTPRRAVYVPQYRSLPYRPIRRQADENVAAFAPVDAFLKDCNTDQHDEAPQQPAFVRYDDENVQSVAEAFPQTIPLDQDERVIPTVLLQEDEINEVIPTPEDVPFIPESEVKVIQPAFIPEYEQPIATEVELPFKKELIPVNENTPVRGLVQPETKKRVRVEIDDDEDDDHHSVSPFHRQGGSNNGNIPANSFFPIQFGSTSGGAIAIANSFSTGKGGSATSHATAYGSPSKSKSSKKRLADA